MGKKSTGTTQSMIYGDTTTTNPYATAHTNNAGTTASFQPGTALDAIYNFVNQNTGSLLNEYLNPTLNSNTNKAMMNEFVNTMNNETYKNLENNIINPLSRRNMIRSSQSTDLYKNLANANSNALSSFVNDLLAESQNRTASVLNNLLAFYMNGYNVLSDMQNTSLQTSGGNAVKNNVNNTSTSPVNDLLSAIQKGTSVFK